MWDCGLRTVPLPEPALMMSCGELGRPPFSEPLACDLSVVEHPRGTDQPSCSAQTIVPPIIVLHGNRSRVEEACTSTSSAQVQARVHGRLRP